METVLDQKVPNLCCPGELREREEVSGLGESIYRREDGGIPVQRGKAGDKVDSCV